jgi:sporulation protein YlmC with PRC-barrel domain
MAKDRNARDLRDQAGVGPDARQVRHLHPLSEMKKVKIASGEPDIRGWNVFTSTGREVGEVQDLLVDTTIGQVVMLDIDVAGSHRRSLAPIRAAWVDRDTKRVVLDSAQLRDDEAFPSFDRMQTTDEEWNRFDTDYRRTYGTRGFDEDSDWELEDRDERVRFGRRRDDIERERQIEIAREQEAERMAAQEEEDYRVERRRMEAMERERAERERLDLEAREREMNEVHYDERALRTERPMVIEEHVVRRRVVDEGEIDRR